MESLIKKYYGLDSFQLKHLEGFEDKTYLVKASGEKYIFKQYQFSDKTLALIEAENRVLEKLAQVKDFHFPSVIPAIDNRLYFIFENSIYRLLTYLEGILLGDAEQSFEMIYSLGSLLGSMDKHLKSDYEPVLRARNSEWDLRYFELNLPYLDYIDDPADRSLVRYFFLLFNERVKPNAQHLRKSNIHSDANDWNIITDGEKVTGIFDFGDMTHSWLINELAIAIPYVAMNKDKPLDAAVQLIKGYNEQIAVQENELDILYYLVAARLCTSVCQSAFGKRTKPDSDYVTISEKPAWELLYKWIRINPLKAAKVFRESVGFKWAPPSKESELKKNRGTYLSKSLSLSYEEPIAMYGAAFQYMYDQQGNTLLDAYNNIMLAGHCHPKVVDAGQRAMAQLNTNTRYLYDSINDYAEQLLSKFPEPLNKIIFVNSGSEASDLAIRMARQHSGKKKLLVLENGYHGNTASGIQASHYKFSQDGGIGKSDNTVVTTMPKSFGSGFKDDGSSGDHFASICQHQISKFGGEIAAFIAEPIMGCGGQVPLAKGYLRKVYQMIRDQGGVCISDEVQVGFGRVGSHFWGFEIHEVVPDIVVLGKPMGNGHPIGAVVTTESISSSFEQGPEFFSSFGGNPVSSAIGKAVLDVIDEESLQERAHLVGSYLKSLFIELQKKYHIIADVRGQGMFLGIELADKNHQPLTEIANTIKNELRNKHILVGTDGPHNNVIKIKPPLSFNRANAEALSREIDHVIRAIL